ncbi:cysteine hydrolase family protein [Alkalihalobacillus sp. AL-G]|uniref:cysteine hydrolase family protein n=1 Tax=Alkalihalobacillus sp. AL-G TaxID=2926399 RepID=UPI00272BCACA|nr:cysteine hydrolase family protein [Alkalihalobacillus sp. AL-G]WLD94248.1 cysteine hydrolase [Alkalihalobacillus sp. AL-G]
MSKEVLMVIDVQSAVMEESSHNREETIDRISGLIRNARERNVAVIYVQHEFPEGPMKRGEQGWQLHPQLEQPLSNEVIINKTLPNSFAGTTLKQTLDQLHATHLYICGAQTDYCVDSTCRGAFDLQFDVTLITDAHTTADNEHLTAEQIIQHTENTLKNFWSPNSTITLKKSSDILWMQKEVRK